MDQQQAAEVLRNLDLRTRHMEQILPEIQDAVSRMATKEELASATEQLRRETASLREEMHGGFNELRGETASLRGETAGLRAETASLREEMHGGFDELRRETASLRGETASLRAETTGLRAETTGLRAETTGLRAETTSLRQDLEEFKEETRAEFVKVHTEMAEFREERRADSERTRDEFRRHTAILLEESRTRIQLLADGLDNVREASERRDAELWEEIRKLAGPIRRDWTLIKADLDRLIAEGRETRKNQAKTTRELDKVKTRVAKLEGRKTSVKRKAS